MRTSAFPTTTSGGSYWSSTTLAGDAGRAWVVNMHNTEVNSEGITKRGHYALCVKGAARSWP